MGWRANTFFASLALSMLAVIATGIVTLESNDLGGWGARQNLIGWGIGFALALALRPIPISPRGGRVALALLIAGCALAFLGPAQQGVHRWLSLGPVTANLAALLCPAIIVLLSRQTERLLFSTTFALSALFAAQPDLSQALGVMLAVVALAFRPGALLRIPVLAVAFWGVVGAALRPDPLQPVIAVEGIVALAFSTSMALGLLMAAGLGAICILPWVGLRNSPEARAGAALSAYILGISVAPALGAYPVPFAGLGMSFPIGLWLAIGLMRPATNAAPGD